MINAITTALSGLNTASKQVNQSAQSIAESPSNEQLIEDIIDIKVAETAYKADIEVIKATDDLTKELLHTFDKKV